MIASMADARPLLAVTMGDPSGIGPEIVVKALAHPETRATARPLVIGDAEVLEEAIRGCGLDLEVSTLSSEGEVTADTRLVEVLDLDNVGTLRHGAVDPESGRAAVEYIERAAELVRGGRVDGIVTAPLNKEAIWASGSGFPGHTEMLADLLGVASERVFTMFVLEDLRIFFLTRHHSLSGVFAQITRERVRDGLVRVDELLRELGFAAPRLALAALNPHAGENGKMGTEELTTLRPAVEDALAAGIDVRGPIPADAVFHQCRQGQVDAVLSLYHDQGHVAAKTLDFFGAVSCTLGLPVIRTSVDHGTAFDIAGTWVAEARGQVAAMRVAAELAPRIAAARAAIAARP
jgi:4-phospho-D-threonate 3-dehydrogenase / 4-phospho-D-erythronate 3-dehydrogenase